MDYGRQRIDMARFGGPDAAHGSPDRMDWTDWTDWTHHDGASRVRGVPGAGRGTGAAR